jgi:AcrR family transcriptional regulator
MLGPEDPTTPRGEPVTSHTTAPDPSAFELVVADRKDVVTATVETLARLGYTGTSFEDVAETAQTTVAAVRRHFPSWLGLVLAAVDRWNQDRFELVARETAGGATLGFMRGLVAYSAQHPGLSRTLMALSVEASDPSHLAALYLRDRYCDFHTMVQQGLAFDVTEGVVPAGTDIKAFSTTVIALFEGLQLQMLMRPGFDPATAFDHALEELTCSW